MAVQNPQNINDPDFYASIQDAINDTAEDLNNLIRSQNQLANAVQITGQQAFGVRRTYQNTQRDLAALMMNQARYNEGELKTAQIRRDINKQMATSRLLEVQIATARLNGQTNLAFYLEAQRKINEDLIVENNELLRANEQIDAQVGLVGSLLKGLKRLPIIGDVLQIDDAIREMRVLSAEGASVGRVALKGITTAFSDISGVLNLGAALTFIVTKAMQADEQATNLAKSLGISKEMSYAIRENFVQYAATSESAFITTERLLKAHSALSDELGISGVYSAKNADEFARLTDLMGLSVEQAGKLSRLSVINGRSISATTKSIMLGAFQAGITNKIAINQTKVLKEVAGLSAGILVKFRENPLELGKAVIQAKALGTTLEGLDKIGESLLNWETSIQNELKAELITGRQLNVERARYAALTGDQVTLAKEVISQVGNLHDFQKMNVIAQKSLADAFGLSRDELSGMLIEQDKFNKLGDVSNMTAQQQLEIAKERGLSIEDSLYQQLQQQSAQEKFNQAIEKLSDILGNIMAGPVGQLIDGFANLASNATAIKIAMGAIAGISLTKLIMSAAGLAVQFGLSAAGAITTMNAATLGIGAVAIIAGIAASMAAFSSAKNDVQETKVGSMNDGIIDPNGGMVVQGPKGSIQLDKNDSIIAGTNLGYNKSRKDTPTKPNDIDIKPLIDAINDVKKEVSKLYNKEGNIYLDGKKVGTALTQGTHRLA